MLTTEGLFALSFAQAQRGPARPTARAPQPDPAGAPRVRRAPNYSAAEYCRLRVP
jgi:hypothetical protein